MKKIFFTSLLLIFTSQLFAQEPPNNDCANAISLTDLNNYCTEQLFGEPTFDITDGPCAPAFNPALNIWYKFTAVGSQVTIGATAGSNIYKITLVKFPFGPCGITEIIDCNTSVLTSTNLIIGDEYYAMISGGNVAGNFELCINNPLPNPPPNNEPCAAILLQSEVPSCGTTVDASATFMSGLPCPAIASNQIWYQVTIPAGQSNLEIALLASTLSGGTQVILGQWTNGCMGTFQYEEAHVYCGPAINTFGFTCMQPGIYYVLLSSGNAGAGDFCITARTYGSPPGCALNDVCANAIQVPAFSMNQSPVCVEGCNIGACGEDFTSPGCNYNGGVVWFSVKTPFGASHLNITLNSPDGSLASPQIQVFSGGCNNLSAVTGCNIGGNGNLNLLGLYVSHNTTYWIAVGNNSGSPGTFNICFSASDPTTVCTTNSEVTVTGTSMGSPLNGPYFPGEEVSFTYTFNFSSLDNGIQWPHGVVPVAGPCWDNPNAGFKTGSNGNWQWFDDPIVTYNSTNPFVKLYYGADGSARLCFWIDPTCAGTGLIPGDYMPPGWWHINQQGQCGGNISDPNNSWGMPCGASCVASFSFKLKTKTFENCDGNQAVMDCGIQFYVFSDFQTGCWLTGGENTCAADYPAYFNTSLNCCKAPVVETGTYTICSGLSTDIELKSDQDDDGVLYEWNVSVPFGVSGAASGSGEFIRQTLVNNSSELKTVYYRVRGSNVDGCNGGRSDIIVHVVPAVKIDIHTIPENGCADESFDVSVSSTGGLGGPYNYLWSYLQYTDNTIIGITPDMEGDFPISVTVTDSASGCSAEASTIIRVGPVEEITFQMEKMQYCYNEGPVHLRATPAGGNWVSLNPEVVLENNVFDTRQPGAAGLYQFVYSVDENVCVKPDTLSIEIIFSARDCPDKSIEIYTDGTESPITGTINTLPFPDNLQENTSVRIFDTLGKELYYSKNYQNDWNADKYPAGLYFFIVTSEGKTFQRVISLIK